MAFNNDDGLRREDMSRAVDVSSAEMTQTIDERGKPEMKAIFAVIPGTVILILAQWGPASGENTCPDPWAKLQGTYKCEGSCNYTASVCNLPEYATGYKRWRFTNAQGVSTTGILVTSGTGTISFATTGGWTFTAANTADCGATIQFDGDPKGVTWRRVDESTRICGGRSSSAKR
jgi:hypothetical protein